MEPADSAMQYDTTQHNIEVTDRYGSTVGAYVLAVIPMLCLSALPQTSPGLSPTVVYAYRPVTIITHVTSSNII